MFQRDATAIDIIMLIYFLILFFGAMFAGKRFLALPALKRGIAAILMFIPFAIWVIAR